MIVVKRETASDWSFVFTHAANTLRIVPLPVSVPFAMYGTCWRNTCNLRGKRVKVSAVFIGLLKGGS